MVNIIDIHSHILPEIDDGAQNLTETKKLLKNAWDHGTCAVIATPHYNRRRGYTPSSKQIRRALDVTRQVAREINPNFRIYSGMELQYTSRAIEDLEAGRVLTLNNTNHLLVEFSPTDPYEVIRSALQRIQFAGYQPVLAHIERYEALRKSVEQAADIKNLGVRIQVNGMSLTGKNRVYKKYARTLLKNDLIDCIASDAHDSRLRPTTLDTCYKWVEKKAGARQARRLFFENPLSLIR